MRDSVFKRIGIVVGRTAAEKALLPLFIVVIASCAIAPNFSLIAENWPVIYRSEGRPIQRFLLPSPQNISPKAPTVNAREPNSVNPVGNPLAIDDGREEETIASIGSSEARPERTRREALGIMAIDFTLPDAQQLVQDITITNDGMIEIEKALFYGQSQVGPIAIRIDDGAQLYLNSEQIRAVLSDNPNYARALDALPKSGFHSIQKMRDVGIDLRYNPTTDHFVLRNS